MKKRIPKEVNDPKEESNTLSREKQSLERKRISQDEFFLVKNKLLKKENSHPIPAAKDIDKLSVAMDNKKRSKNEVILQKSRKLTTSVNSPICPMKGNIQVIFVLH